MTILKHYLLDSAECNDFTYIEKKIKESSMISGTIFWIVTFYILTVIVLKLHWNY